MANGRPTAEPGEQSSATEPRYAGGGSCTVCGGPLRRGNRTGICNRNPRCRQASNAARNTWQKAASAKPAAEEPDLLAETLAELGVPDDFTQAAARIDARAGKNIYGGPRKCEAEPYRDYHEKLEPTEQAPSPAPAADRPAGAGLPYAPLIRRGAARTRNSLSLKRRPAGECPPAPIVNPASPGEQCQQEATEPAENPCSPHAAKILSRKARRSTAHRLRRAALSASRIPAGAAGPLANSKLLACPCGNLYHMADSGQWELLSDPQRAAVVAEFRAVLARTSRSTDRRRAHGGGRRSRPDNAEGRDAPRLLKIAAG